MTDPRVQQPLVVVNLGHRTPRRPRVLGRSLLVDRDRRREPFNDVHVGLFHLTEELPRVGRQRLDVPPLALGIDRVEGERRLARPRKTGEDHQLVARDRQRDVLEVVLAGAANRYLVDWQRIPIPSLLLPQTWRWPWRLAGRP